MNIREVNVNSQRTQVLKEGRVVDQNSTTTKEVRFPKYRVTQQISELGRADFDLEVSHDIRLLSRFCQTLIYQSRSGGMVE